jgi:hypothetical protein
VTDADRILGLDRADDEADVPDDPVESRMTDKQAESFRKVMAMVDAYCESELQRQVDTLRNFYFPTGGRSAAKPRPTGACYEASFGWVHVKPGCHCPH